MRFGGIDFAEDMQMQAIMIVGLGDRMNDIAEAVPPRDRLPPVSRRQDSVRCPGSSRGVSRTYCTE